MSRPASRGTYIHLRLGLVLDALERVLVGPPLPQLEQPGPAVAEMGQFLQHDVLGDADLFAQVHAIHVCKATRTSMRTRGSVSAASLPPTLTTAPRGVWPEVAAPRSDCPGRLRGAPTTGA